MRRPVLATALGAAATAAVTAAVAGGTFAAFTATSEAPSQVVGSATVVLGGRGDPPRLTFDGVEPAQPRTFELVVANAGSVPVAVDLRLAVEPATTSCPAAGSAAATDPLRIRFGSGPDRSYCSLLRTREPVSLATALAPGTTERIDVTVSLAGPGPEPRVEESALVLRASDGQGDGRGFSDSVTGSITIDTGQPAARRGPAPETSTTDTPPSPPPNEGTPPEVTPPDATPPPTPSGGAEVEIPAECAAAGMTADTFDEIVVLGPDDRTYAADPGAGPVLVIGTGGDDTITGSAAGDCLDGGAGDDVVDGAGGPDVLVGGPGADRIDGRGDAARCVVDDADVAVTGCPAGDPPTTTAPEPTPPPDGPEPP